MIFFNENAYRSRAVSSSRFGYTLPLLARRSESLIEKRDIESGSCSVVVDPGEVRDQNVFGSCVGQSFAFWMSRFTGKRISGQFIWTEARRRAGTLKNTTAGTSPSAALWACEHVGVVKARANETDNTESNWRYASGPDMASELAAHDLRLQFDAFHISPTSESAISDIATALSSGYGCIMTSGLLRDFWLLNSSNDVASDNCIGGIDNGHCQSIYATDGDSVSVLNSWGTKFARGGAYQLRREGLANAWEILVFRPEIEVMP